MEAGCYLFLAEERAIARFLTVLCCLRIITSMTSNCFFGESGYWAARYLFVVVCKWFYYSNPTCIVFFIARLLKFYYMLINCSASADEMPLAPA